jgi:hypothetical protein
MQRIHSSAGSTVYERTKQPGKALKVLTEFDAANLASWFYKKIVK